jgi:O-antigen ligase
MNRQNVAWGLATVAFGVSAGVAATTAIAPWLLLFMALALAFGLATRAAHLSAVELLVLLCPIMFFSSATSALHVAASDLLLPFMMLGWVASAATGASARGQGPTPAFAGYSLLLLASVLLGLFLVTAEGLPVDANEAGVGLLKLVVGLSYAAVAAASTAAMDMNHVRRTLRIWGWVAATLCLASIVTVMGIPLVRASDSRVYGYFDDPNLYAGYLLLSIPVVLAADAIGRIPERNAILAIVAIGIVLTASRSAILGLAFMLVLVLLFVRSQGRLRSIKVFIALCALFAVPATGLVLSVLGQVPAVQRLSAAFTSSADDPRFQLWRLAIDLWEANPIAGIGLGQYPLYSTNILGVSGRTGNGFVAHNTFLTVLAENGLLGGLAVAVGAAFLIRAVRRLRSHNSYLSGALQLGIVTIAVQMMSLNLHNVRYVWVFFGICMGVGYSIQREALSIKSSTPTVSDVSELAASSVSHHKSRAVL